MGFPNVALRGGTYYWRKKITVAGTCLTLSLPLRTGNFNSARSIALRLGTAVETLRMAYGQSSGMGPDKLKRVFSDAMRWQLQRILEDQAGSRAPAGEHATTNSIHAEAWSFLARNGPDAKWSLDDLEQLVAGGWKFLDAKAVGNAVFDYQSGSVVSGSQLQSYVERFGISSTQDNLDRMKRTVCAARAAACREATGRLSAADDFTADWIQDALADTTPFAFEQMPESGPEGHPASMAAQKEPPAPTSDNPGTTGAKKLLLEATEECIALHESEKAWDTVTVGQVRTALRLFDHACGCDVHIQDLEQAHVQAFVKLCRALPGRWGRTAEEKAGGIAASLDRATRMNDDDVGLSQATINKHLTWITAVLEFAAGDNEADGHRPAQPLSFKSARKGIARKARLQRKRDRDKRASWSKQEIAHLLSAPVWTGAAGIDRRLEPGTDIIHDAWYWLPIMLVLYGGRSSELAGLALTEVHEQAEIPHFVIDFTEDRKLKTVQSIRKLPVHPELIRLGFIEYVTQIRAAGCKMLFPEMSSPNSSSFASTFYKSIFSKWRAWAFPNGTAWRHKQRGAWKDKDVHSFRGTATSLLKGHVQDSVRCDLFGHEGETETSRTYDEEADLGIKLEALRHITLLTAHIRPSLPIRIRPADRLRHGVRASSQVRA